MTGGEKKGRDEFSPVLLLSFRPHWCVPPSLRLQDGGYVGVQFRPESEIAGRQQLQTEVEAAMHFSIPETETRAGDGGNAAAYVASVKPMEAGCRVPRAPSPIGIKP